MVSVVATRQNRSEGSNIKKRRAVRSAWSSERFAPARGEKQTQQGIRDATFAGQTVSPDQVANGTMATLPTRAQPDQGVGQHVGYCKSHWRKDGVFAQRSQSRNPLQHGNGTGEGQGATRHSGVSTDHNRRCSCINLAPLSLH